MSRRNTSNFTISHEYCFGGLKKKRADALKRLDGRITKIVMSAVDSYEVFHPGSAISGTIDIFIDELPGRHLPNRILGRSDTTLRRAHPKTGVSYKAHEQNCIGLPFCYPYRQRLVNIWLKMKIVDSHDLGDSKSAADAIEMDVISDFLHTLPQGNRYLNDISRRARHHTAKEMLKAIGEDSIDSPGKYLEFLKKYGFDITRDNKLLMSIWNNKSEEKEVGVNGCST